MLQITGGLFRGRKLFLPKDQSKVRPTLTKVRSALFNSLQTVIADASVLDLFAGSGALGFEALSWGARSAVFVDDLAQSLQVIEKNKELLKLDEQVTIVRGRITDQGGLPPTVMRSGPYDLVFADPPYREGWEKVLLEKVDWSGILREGGILCLESSKHFMDEFPEKSGILVKTRQKNYGDTVLTHYARQS